MLTLCPETFFLLSGGCFTSGPRVSVTHFRPSSGPNTGPAILFVARVNTAALYKLFFRIRGCLRITALSRITTDIVIGSRTASSRVFA